jgi:prepilin-type N-terminal cleavage/methylation domain-containing protein
MYCTPRQIYQPATGRRGFTLVELLVVIAIIGILVALLLPAIQAAREAARRVQCQNNLKNLALAALNFENQNGGLPPASQASRAAGAVERLDLYTGKQLSWIVYILPFIEEQALLDQFDLEASAIQQDADTLPHENQLNVLLCPSDGAIGRTYQSRYTRNRSFGKGNYVAYVSPEHVVCMRVFPGAMIDELQPLSRITDGTSHTLMLTEVRTRDHLSDERGAWALAWNGTSVISLDMHSVEPRAGCSLASQRNSPFVPLEFPDVPALTPNSPPGLANADRLRECPEPNAADLELMPCDPQGTNSTWIAAAPRSLHVGGVNATNVDGSITWLADDIDPYFLARRISINDGQINVDGYSKQ